MSNMYAHYLYIFIYVFLISVSSVANLERRVGDERPHLYRVEPIMKENGNNETIKIVENVTTLKDLTTSTVTLFNETSINDITTSQVDNNEQESNASLDNLPNRTDFSTENSDITTVDTGRIIVNSEKQNKQKLNTFITDDTQGREYYYSTEDGVSPTVSNYYKKIKNETNSDNNSYNETEATSLDNSTTTETNSSNESDKHTAVSDIGESSKIEAF